MLYVYSLSCNDRSKYDNCCSDYLRFASLILSQPCYLQASLKELFEDVTCRKDDDTTTQPIENNSNLLESLLQAQEDIERLNKVKVGILIDSLFRPVWNSSWSKPRRIRFMMNTRMIIRRIS